MSAVLQRKHVPMMLLLTVALAIGILTLPNYGESWDEADIYRYGDYAIGAYQFILHPRDLPEFGTNLNLYGPGYFMAAGRIAALLASINSAWSLTDAWHLVYFATFLAGALALYLLALRWMSTPSAMGVVLLFLTQPLLWGHAFINPKDIPFMACFTATVYSGLKMVDESGGSPRIHFSLITAALLLGLTSSMRVLGPLAGIIVLGNFVRRLGSKAVWPAAEYLGIAVGTAYLSWPYLWPAPVAHYLKSIETMAEFPFASSILFAGTLYKANQIPPTYFPTILGIQLTEPALVLIAGGLLASTVKVFKGQVHAPILLFLFWFLLPALLVVGLRSALYDNARQLLFLLPPLFLLAGLSFEALFARLTQPAIRAAILALAILPGVLVGARLHPYEYVYYNALVGGTGGAFRRYEMDYWGSSFTELTEHLNQTAREGARVLVYGPEQIVAKRARSDIQVFIPRDDTTIQFDYVAMLTRSNADQRRCRGAETVYSIGRRGAIFSLLRSIPAGVECR